MFSALMHAFSRPPFRPGFEGLEIRQWHTAHAVIVRVFGELWSTNIPPLREAIARIVEQPTRVVVIDLTNVSFIGSQGISTMLSLSRTLALAGAELRIVAPRSSVRDTFEATHMHRVLKLRDTVAAALTDGRAL